MKIRPVYHAERERETERQKRTKLKAAFRNFAYAAKVEIFAHECKQLHIQTGYPCNSLTLGFATESYCTYSTNNILFRTNFP